jgi:hypothetical protein
VISRQRGVAVRGLASREHPDPGGKRNPCNSACCAPPTAKRASPTSSLPAAGPGQDHLPGPQRGRLRQGDLRKRTDRRERPPHNSLRTPDEADVTRGVLDNCGENLYACRSRSRWNRGTPITARTNFLATTRIRLSTRPALTSYSLCGRARHPPGRVESSAQSRKPCEIPGLPRPAYPSRSMEGVRPQSRVVECENDYLVLSGEGR